MSEDQCYKCLKVFNNKTKSLNCNQCHNNFHLKCTNISKKRYDEINANENLFTCNTCSQSCVCKKTVAKNHHAILCSLCNSWVHIRCQKFDKKEYQRYQEENLVFHCIKCISDSIPFSLLSDTEFTIGVTNGINFSELSSTEFNLGISQQNIINMLKRTITNDIFMHDKDDSNEDDESNSSITCQYYDIDEFKNKKFKSDDYFSMYHLNIHSIQLHIEDLRTVLKMLNFKFDIICLTETKLMDGVPPITNISIDGYQEPIRTDTNATKGGVIIYVKNGINFIPRKDLEMNKSKELESNFIEIICGGKNTIVGVVYRHPSMDEAEFIEEYLDPTLEKITRENKKTYVGGDWNFNILKYPNHKETNLFVETMMSKFLMPTITLPTKINYKNSTVIDNIFVNDIDPNMCSGNLTVIISDHLPSFFLVPTTKETMKKSSTHTDAIIQNLIRLSLF